MNHIRRLAVFVPYVCLFLASLDAQQSRVAGRIDNGSSVVLQGGVHPLAQTRYDQGAVEDSFPLPGITLLLKPSAEQQAALQQLLQDQQDPSSPGYRRWLTPEQYADRFGVSANDLNAISAWLQSQGFNVTDTARSRTWVRFDGTAGQARGAFQTQIHRYQVAGETHFANGSDPSIPAALSDVVAGFHGLNDFRMKPRSVRQALTPEISSGGSHYLAPDDLAAIYNITPLYAQDHIDGSGQRIVVVGQTAINLSDITRFRGNFGLSTANLQQVRVPGTNPGISSGDLPEADLDIEWAGAVARNATIVYVYSDDVWTSAMYAVANNLGTVITMSYGTCEQSDLVDLPASQLLAQQANAQGMTWLAAAGDLGAGDCEDLGAVIAQDGLAVDVPASIPEVTGMGGTTLSEQLGCAGLCWSSTGSALSYIPEVAWNGSSSSGLGATGGGASVYFSKPSWQTEPGVPNDAARHVPDLALSSSANHDGYYVYTGGSAAYYGGTSCAAPSMAGIVALLNQYLGQSGLGNINPTLYRLAQSTAAGQVFHDVTSGNNKVPCVPGSPDCSSGSFGYSAGAGYDQATGLGSVNAFNLVHLWGGQAPTASAVVVSIDQNPVYQDASGSTWTFNLKLNEEAGIGTTLTGFTIDGVSYTSQIASLLGGAAIPSHGSLSAKMQLNNVAVPKTVTFVFSGADSGGQSWTVQFAVPFTGRQIPLTVSGISNAASFQQVYAPGMLMSVFGTNLGQFAQSAGTLPLPDYLAGFEASINGVTTPLYYVSPNQVNLQIPYETRPGIATLTVGNPYDNVNYTFQVAAAGPGIFTYEDGSGAVTPFNTAARGQTVTLYITGEGQVTPSVTTGTAPSPRTPSPQPRLPVTVTVGGVQATTTFIGIPTWSVGVTQINYTIPQNGPLGVQSVVVSVGNVPSMPAKITVTP